MLDNIETPLHVVASKDSYQQDTMIFISENDETVTFIKTKEIHEAFIEERTYTVDCSKNDDKFVDIEYDKRESVFEFSSENGSTITIKYSSTPNLSIYGSKSIENLEWLYRINIAIKLPSFDTDISNGKIAMWNDPNQVDSFNKPLEETFSFGGSTYDDVFFWSAAPFGSPLILYVKNYELVGFVDDRQVRWIKKN